MLGLVRRWEAPVARRGSHLDRDLRHVWSGVCAAEMDEHELESSFSPLDVPDDGMDSMGKGECLVGSRGFFSATFVHHGLCFRKLHSNVYRFSRSHPTQLIGCCSSPILAECFGILEFCLDLFAVSLQYTNTIWYLVTPALRAAIGNLGSK